jgi:hypothetical protein
VRRRNLIPLALLAVLGVLTLLFAVLGASSAPSAATLTVQNAAGETFGTPSGSTSFIMDLVDTVTTGATTGPLTQVRQIVYVPPNRMAVYQVGSRLRFLAALGPSAITCTLSAYTTLVGGPTPWVPSGGAYTRTESLADYSARVPHVTPSSCAPRPSTVRGQVHEKAVIRSGYLIGVRLTVVVPPQTLPTGGAAAHGTESEAVVMVRINGTPVRALGS